MPPKPKIGLALGSGGWRGLAHIGVIKSLIKHGYSISAIAGTSAGSLIGGLYAINQDIKSVESEFDRLTYQDLLFVFSDPSIKLGILSGKKTLNFFQKYIKHQQIESLQIPLKVIASDILSGNQVIIDSGDLAFAIRASSSIPIVFEPVKYQDYFLIDGGVTDPVPVDVLRTMNVDITIAVNLYGSIFPIQVPSSKISKLNLVSLSTQTMLNRLSNIQGQQADLLITPKLADAGSELLTKFINNQKAIDQGELAMDQAIPQLESIIASRL